MHLDQFNYSILGSNSANRVVFVHGLMAFSANWRKIANKIEDEFQCLIYDQRGHGRSFKPETGYTPEIFAEDLNIITNELGWTHFHLVGHSMGARNSMVFAHLYPQKVKTLTIEDMGPTGDPSVYEYYKGLFAAIPTPFAGRTEVQEFFANRFANVFKPTESLQVLSLFLQSNMEEKADGKYDWKFSKAAMLEIVRDGNSRDFWGEVSSLRMPTLLVRGQNSNVLKQDTFNEMLEVNSIITGVEIAGAGHWIHYEKYAEFAATLRDFLKLHNA